MGKNWRDKSPSRNTDELTQPGRELGWPAYCLRLVVVVALIYGIVLTFATYQ
ncbi:MAG: hypothetical protein AAB472_03125 [Patescibacteria group bacterium]